VQDYIFVQSLTEVYQAARLRHSADVAGMLPTDHGDDPDSVLDNPFAWQVRCELCQPTHLLPISGVQHGSPLADNFGCSGWVSWKG
jgi:hypothetical protein